MAGVVEPEVSVKEVIEVEEVREVDTNMAKISSDMIRPFSEEGDVVSPISGIVLNIDVNLGDQVTKGDEIITIEAMNMNTFVSASSTGKISEILV